MKRIDDLVGAVVDRICVDIARAALTRHVTVRYLPACALLLLLLAAPALAERMI